MDFIITSIIKDKVSGSLNIDIHPDESFKITKLEYDSGGLYIDLNGIPTNIKDINREKTIMIAAYLDGSWDGK